MSRSRDPQYLNPELSRNLRKGDICTVIKRGYKPFTGIATTLLKHPQFSALDTFTLENEGVKFSYYRRDLREGTVKEMEEFLRNPRNAQFQLPF